MTFYHEYVDLNIYRVRGSDGRIWSKTDELYLEFCQVHTPENISGDEFVLIIDGVVIIDPNKNSILAQRVIDAEAEQAKQQAIAYAIVANLPSWTQVETAVNNISNLAEAKAFLLKLSKVVYHHVKRTTN